MTRREIARLYSALSKQKPAIFKRAFTVMEDAAHTALLSGCDFYQAQAAADAAFEVQIATEVFASKGAPLL
jgi:hypothetical protein